MASAASISAIGKGKDKTYFHSKTGEVYDKTRATHLITQAKLRGAARRAKKANK